MHMHARSLVFMVAMSLSLSACGSSPDSLAADLQKALEAGDMAAAKRLALLDGTPADLRFFYLSMVADCAKQSEVCTVTTAPLDDEFKADLVEQKAKQSIEPAVAPEGLVVVASKSESGSGTMRMPYGKVDGKYRLVSLRYTPEEIARLKAKTNETLLEEFFALGVYDPASGERRTDWKEHATQLPPGGGEPAAQILAQRAALARAADANDPDAAAKSGDGWAQMVFKDTDWNDKPVPRRDRELSLAAQSMRFLRDITVHDAYQRGADVVLLFDAKDGAGWINRGVMFMSREEGGGWSPGGYHTVSYPPEG
jgi:hypothetical protein